jgi:hypothetical protein
VRDVEKIHVDVADLELVIEYLDLVWVKVGEKASDGRVEVGFGVVVSFQKVFKAKDVVGVLVGDYNAIDLVGVDLGQRHAFQ